MRKMHVIATLLSLPRGSLEFQQPWIEHGGMNSSRVVFKPIHFAVEPDFSAR